MRANNPDIPLSLPLEDLNKMLRWIGEQKFNEVADTIVEIRNQIMVAVARINREQQQIGMMGQEPRVVREPDNGHVLPDIEAS
jgi:hypothetical protein